MMDKIKFLMELGLSLEDAVDFVNTLMWFSTAGGGKMFTPILYRDYTGKAGSKTILPVSYFHNLGKTEQIVMPRYRKLNI